MRRVFASLVAIALTSAACLPAHAPLDDASKDLGANQAYVADLEAKTVALVNPVHDDELAEMLGLDQTGGPIDFHVYCSGVWIDKNTIVTANHCVDDLKIGDNVFYATKADTETKDQVAFAQIHMADLVALDPDHDLALVRVLMPPSHPWAELARNVVSGQPDATMGHPLGLLWSYSEGVVSGSRNMTLDDLNQTWVQSTAPISPGNSGGGLFDSREQLLGICSRYVPDGENLNFYVHVDYVRSLYRATFASTQESRTP